MKRFIKDYYDYLSEGFPKDMTKKDIEKILIMIADNEDKTTREMVYEIKQLIPNDFWYSFYDIDKKVKKQEKLSELEHIYNLNTMIDTVCFKFNMLYRLNDAGDIYDQLHGIKIIAVGDNLTCENCKKRNNKILKLPLELKDIPPYKDCKHEDGYSCRCYFEDIFKWEVK